MNGGVQHEVKKKQRGLLSFLFAVARAIFWGFLVGMLINGFMWHHEGYQALMKDLKITYQEQVNGIALRNQAISDHYDLAVNGIKETSQREEAKAMSWLDHFAKGQFLKNSPEVTQKAHGVVGFIDHLVNVAWGTLEVLIAKFFSVFASFWVFIFAAFLGAMDGLLARYIRTQEGGRESTFIFHRVSDVVIRLPIGILFLYLTLPFFLNPEMVVVIVSVLFFSFFYLATANLKKFL